MLMLNIISIITALWFGSIISLGIFILPTLFKFLDKPIAGKIAAYLFNGINIYSLTASILILILLNNTVHTSVKHLFASGISKIAKKCQWYLIWILILSICSIFNIYIMNNIQKFPNKVMLFNHEYYIFPVMHSIANVIYFIIAVLVTGLYVNVLKLIQNSNR